MRWTFGYLVWQGKEFKNVALQHVPLSRVTMVAPVFLELLCGRASAQKGEMWLVIINLSIKK